MTRPVLYATDHLIGAIDSIALRLLSIELWSDRLFLRICADEASIPPLTSTGEPGTTRPDAPVFRALSVEVTGDGIGLPAFYSQAGGTGLEWTSNWGFRLEAGAPDQLNITFAAARGALSPFAFTVPTHR